MPRTSPETPQQKPAPTSGRPEEPVGALPRPGQRLELTIQDLGSEGQGLGRLNRLVVFVPGAVPGDQVRARITTVRRGFVEAELETVLQPGPGRVVPACQVADACGGCQLLALSYEGQLAWKTRVVSETLRRVGHLQAVPVRPCLGAQNPYGYRNKAQFPIVAVYRPGKVAHRAGEPRPRAGLRAGLRTGLRAGLRAGLYRRGTHEVVPVDSCLLQHPVNNAILAAAVRLASKLGVPAYDEDTGEGLLRHILARVSSDGREAMAVFVTSQVTFPMGRRLAAALAEAVPQVKTVVQNVNTRRTNVILGPRDIVLSGPGHIVDHLGGLRFRVSASSFFQVNPAQAEVLYGVTARMAEGARRVADVYCGVGTITLFLAKRLPGLEEIVGVESNPAAARDAAANAKANGIDKASYICGDAAAVLRDMARAQVPLDMVVLDPPRKGCEPAVLQALLRLGCRKIVYVSCNPATLARDLAVLAGQAAGAPRGSRNGSGGDEPPAGNPLEAAGGFAGSGRVYRVEEVQPVDMFPQTTHVECVVCLRLTRR